MAVDRLMDIHTGMHMQQILYIKDPILADGKIFGKTDRILFCDGLFISFGPRGEQADIAGSGQLGSVQEMAKQTQPFFFSVSKGHSMVYAALVRDSVR